MKYTGATFRSVIVGFTLLYIFCGGGDSITNDPLPDPQTNPVIVYVSNILNFPEIFVMDADGSNQANLTDNRQYNTYPIWSPDGNRILYNGDFDGGVSLVVIDADGSNITKVGPGDDRGPNASWSPDGSKIAFKVHTDGIDFSNLREVFVVNSDGSDLHSVSPNTSDDDVPPSWSPDGSKIAFFHNGDIYVIDVDGSNRTQLTDNNAGDRFPVWSPDGSMIAFRRSNNLFVMNADGSNQISLSNVPPLFFAVSWSPDSEKIVFSDEIDDNREIFVINADGTNLRRLTTNTTDDINPDWSKVIKD